MSVKTYSLKKDGEKKLSAHFKVKEFRCKDGSDKILIESALVETLERVYAHFGCSKITVTSGYRTASHDKAVGGKGSGNHVQGKAADFIAYDKKGVVIPSKEVALYLEDIGVKGIGYRCGGSANATHTDVNYRLTKWYGDEKKSMSASVGSSFYAYLGVKYKTVKTTTTVKIRDDVGTSAKAVKTLPKDTAVSLADTATIDRDGYAWGRIKYENKHYWVATKYLK